MRAPAYQQVDRKKQVEAATAVGGGWWVGSQVVGVVRNQFSLDADYVIRRNNPFMPFDNSRKLLGATNHSILIYLIRNFGNLYVI